MNLDDKLREICDANWGAERYHGDSKDEEAIRQIHHAYRDAGYRYVPKQADIQHLIDDGSVSPLETGQEWYNRFKAELPKGLDKYGDAISKGTAKPSHPIMNDPKWMHGYIDMVAKQMHETLDAIVKKEDNT